MADPRTLVAVFHSTQCPACQEYLPEFRKVAARHPSVTVYLIDVDQHPQYADHYQITAMPTTMAMRKPQGVMRAQGIIPEDQIEWFFRMAEQYA